jgi:hypothetical protein
VANIFCQKCGTANHASAQFCSKCGAPLSLTVPQSVSTKAGAGHVVRNLIIVLVIVVIVLVALFTVPVSHSYSSQFTSSILSNAGGTLSPPTGAAVMGHYSTTDGGSVAFQITNGLGSVIYSTDSDYGSFSFSASNPPYTFAASSFLSETVQVSGHWSAPIL